MHARILVIDDEAAIRRSISRLLGRIGYEVFEADNAADGIAIVDKQEIDVALVDLNLRDPQGLDGHALIKQISVDSPHTRCVMVTGTGRPDDAWQALSHGAFDYIYKPDLVKSIEGVIERALVWSLAAQDTDFVGMIGRSDATLKMQERIRKVAGLPITALIQGESGVGKERVARAIHALSKSSGPFVALNCAALPEGILESELFGHEKGSFTGAAQTRLGAFERAAGGFLLLDEIGDMPMKVQASLLRVVEQRSLTRLGGSEEIPLKCRVLAATHKPLDKNVRSGLCRQDLYHRLRQFVIGVPPLRERLEDIPMLTWYFVDRFNSEFSRNVRWIAPEAMALLCSRSWSDNNVRQLENGIRGAMIEADGDKLEVRHFDQLYLGLSISDEAEASTEGDTEQSQFSQAWLNETFAVAKREVENAFRRWYLVRKLTETHGVIADAARLSGLQPSNFSREMKRVGISRTDTDGSGS